MKADKTLLQFKYVDVIADFAEKEKITLRQALDVFYHSLIYDEMSKGISDMHCHSDKYLSEELHGAFNTPLPFAKKTLEYIEKALGKEWWKTGEYRLWDMAAGTGNLEYYLPQDALPYCYLSTIDISDVKFLEKRFTTSTVFQYDYLNDDVDNVFVTNDGLKFDSAWKMPKQLLRDLNNPIIKWIILLNPPYAMVKSAFLKGEIKTGTDMKIQQRMYNDGLGKISSEFFWQFIYRIKKEFDGKITHLGVFSTLRYLNANSDLKLRNNVFQFLFENGFMFSSGNFHGISRSNQFPVGFLLWNLSKDKPIEGQEIILDVLNEVVENVGKKHIRIVHWDQFLNNWIKRPPKTENIDRRDRIAENFLASLICKGNDFQNQQSTALLSCPYVGAGTISVTPENFEQAMVVFAARRIPKLTWLNKRDQLMQPNRELSKEFITDCVVWSLFDAKNKTVPLYDGEVLQIHNQFFPFSPQDLKTWDIENDDIRSTLHRSQKSFVVKWLSEKNLSPLTKKVFQKAEEIYRFYFSHFSHLNKLYKPECKIETYDAGWRQIRQALQDAGLGEKEFTVLQEIHDELKEKLLPQLKDYGIIE